MRTGEAVVDVALRILKGEGPKINQIVEPSVIVSRENLAKVADRSWDHNDLTDLAGARRITCLPIASTSFSRTPANRDPVRYP